MPRFPGAYFGFRTWELEGGVLKAACGEPWVNGAPNEAFCTGTPRNSPMGPPPHGQGHHCGFNCFHDIQEQLYIWDNGVFGAMVGWGRLQVHTDGFRCQFALPIGFMVHEKMQVGTLKALRVFAQEWELPLFEDPDDLVREAERYAEPIPLDWRPDKGEMPSIYDYAAQQQNLIALKRLGRGQKVRGKPLGGAPLKPRPVNPSWHMRRSNAMDALFKPRPRYRKPRFK